MATNNGYFGTLVPRIGYTRSVWIRNRVRRSFGQSGAVLGVFVYLIFAVPGSGYLTTGYTRSWLFPFYFCRNLTDVFNYFSNYSTPTYVVVVLFVVIQRSYLHTDSGEVPVLHTPVELAKVRFSMTCRFVDGQGKRGNVHRLYRRSCRSLSLILSCLTVSFSCGIVYSRGNNARE